MPSPMATSGSPQHCSDNPALRPHAAAGFTPGAASATVLAVSANIGQASGWVYCGFKDESVTPSTMSVYKLNVVEWFKVSRVPGPPDRTRTAGRTRDGQPASCRCTCAG